MLTVVLKLALICLCEQLEGVRELHNSVRTTRFQFVNTTICPYIVFCFECKICFTEDSIFSIVSVVSVIVDKVQIRGVSESNIVENSYPFRFEFIRIEEDRK